MLHKNAIKYVKQEYTLIFIYYVIRFGIIRFGSVRIPKLRYSVFRYFTRFGRSLLSWIKTRDLDLFFLHRVEK